MDRPLYAGCPRCGMRARIEKTYWDWDQDEDFYELTCPTCGEHIVIDEVQLGNGEMKCPACGEDLEFDFTALAEQAEKEDEEEELEF